MSQIHSTTQFKINELTLITEFGNYDISGVFDELSIFDNLFTPTMSGKILITDAVGMADKLSLNGNEYIKINISKENTDILNFNKIFRIYKLTDKQNLNQTSVRYILHFVTEEFILAKQLKVSQYYYGRYSSIAESILTDILGVPYQSPNNGGTGFGIFHDSDGTHECIIPNTTNPIEAIRWISKRSVYDSKPDFLFFETPLGFNFVPLNVLFQFDPVFSINFNPKNLEAKLDEELLGARSHKFINNSNVAKDISRGVYAGKFVGFDTMTRTIKTINYKSKDLFVPGQNPYQNIETNTLNKYGKSPEDMGDSRVFSYPFQYPRMESSWISEKNSKQSSIIDNTHEYAMQRKAIFTNLMNRRIQLAMPGNFGFFSGRSVNLNVPKYSNEPSMQDENLSGKYIILGTRHVIRYDKHETIIEVAANSSNRRII